VENDSIRTTGEFTLVDVWIDGKLRSISVSRDAIAAYLHLPADRAETISDDDCREFVRNRLSFVVATAKDRLRTSNPDADTVTITAEQAGSFGNPSFVDRRKGDRRKNDRRTPSASSARLGDRRQNDRRKGDRRKGKPKPPSDGSKT
jgi:hypothetical protein